jgi:transcriptional regulator with XRE-family HTH domain
VGSIDEDHTMETAGERLKRVREKLGLRYREVVTASQGIARRRHDPEYAVALSRLSDIENKGTVPNIFRLYSLCAIYRLDMREVMQWYGVQVEEAAAESVERPLPSTHVAGLGELQQTGPADPMEEADPNRTRFLGHVHRWGRIAAARLAGFDAQHYRYGYIGLEDRFMHPTLEPGALVMIDIRRRKMAAEGWTSERDRPIYFFELRDGYRCAWCVPGKDKVVLVPHPASSATPVAYRFPDEIEVVGEVVGIAMLRAPRAAGRGRGEATPKESPSR